MHIIGDKSKGNWAVQDGPKTLWCGYKTCEEAEEAADRLRFELTGEWLHACNGGIPWDLPVVTVVDLSTAPL